MKMFVCVVCVLMMVSCGNQQSKGESKYEQKILELERKVENLQSVVKVHSELIPAGNILDASSSAYSVVHTNHGPLVVAVDNAKEYLDGYKLKLKVGNLTAGVLTKVKISLTWGPSPSDPGFPDTPSGVEQAYKRHDYDVREELLPGTFNTVEILVSPAKVNELKWIAIKVVVGGVRLKVG